jgi:cyclase
VIKFKICLLLTMGLLLSGSLFAQQEPVYQVTKLTDHIYELTTDDPMLIVVKAYVSIGDDGVLVVDCGQKKAAEGLKKAVLALKNETPKYIIDTHGHLDHIGGNYIFGKEPVIIGHKNLTKSMKTASYAFEDFGPESFPDTTFSDSMSLFFNGEEIKMYTFEGAHDDDDIIVWFTKSKIVCAGDLSNGHHFPSVEQIFGNSTKYGDVTNRVIALLPDDVTIVSGHGADGTVADYRIFNDMCIKTAEIVRNELAKGKDLATLQKEDVLKDYQSFEGGYIDKNMWLNYLVFDIQNPDRPIPMDMVAPIHDALQAKGVDSAIAIYDDFKKKYDKGDGFFEMIISFIGPKLFTNNRFTESLKFCETAIKEYPNSSSLYLYYYYVGRNYQKLENKELAIKNFKKCLELKPDTPKAIQYLKELEGK